MKGGTVMSFSPKQGSAITNTRLYVPNSVATLSGMCAACSADCIGTCEIGQSAIRGDEAIYPDKTDVNQFGSEKNYPLDYSHLNINGRVFGLEQLTPEKMSFRNVDIETCYGLKNKVKMRAPLILPALAKLNWKDYFTGAAISGIPAVIGEDAVHKDNRLVIRSKRVIESPLLREMTKCYRDYAQGYGDIILQANYDDEEIGVLEYAIQSLGIKSVELKLGQGAKGIQGISYIKSKEDAIKFHQLGYLIYPNPLKEGALDAFNNGEFHSFERVGKLPRWREGDLVKRTDQLRMLGAERVNLKVGPFDPRDLINILILAAEARVDLITFDGAGGGSGNSPTKMMNEWGVPTLYLESILYMALQKMKEKKISLPQIAIAGGFSMEDQIFKGLALGAPFVQFVGIGRAAMAAAMVGSKVGDMISKGELHKNYQVWGNDIESVFREYGTLKKQYGDDAKSISTGAIGVYSYINRVSTGLKQFMALNRKYSLEAVDRHDIYPLTPIAAEVTGLKTYIESAREYLDRMW